MSLEDCLVTLSLNGDWHGVIEIGNNFTIEERSKFLWAWPSFDCLQWLNRLFKENNIKTLLSIGCGSGLLEWLISQSTGVRVHGLELDRSWWNSTYSPKTFVDLRFTETHITTDFLRRCAGAEQFALLFCYFNCRDAFLQYIRAFDGDFVILVGPMSEEHIVTDPNPMNPKFEINEWSLLCYYQLNDQNLNCICVFRRIRNVG